MPYKSNIGLCYIQKPLPTRILPQIRIFVFLRIRNRIEIQVVRHVSGFHQELGIFKLSSFVLNNFHAINISSLIQIFQRRTSQKRCPSKANSTRRSFFRRSMKSAFPIPAG